MLTSPKVQEEVPEFVIEDEELDQLKVKYEQSYKLFEGYMHPGSDTPSIQEETKVKIKAQNSLYDLEPSVQDKIRKITLSKLQRSSFVKELTFYPTVVNDSLLKRLGKKTSAPDFNKKLADHFNKQIQNLNEKQNLLFKKFISFYSNHYTKDRFKELKHVSEKYYESISKQKAGYVQIYYRIANENDDLNKEIPEVVLDPKSNVAFTHNVQPKSAKNILTMDYKIYMNDKLKNYKLLRKVKKLREIIKFFPYNIQNRLLTKGDDTVEISEEKSGSPRLSYNSLTKLDIEPKPVEQHYENPFSRNYDVDKMKSKVVSLCQKFGLNDDINIDNGAFLLFKIDSYFKERYAEQQRTLKLLKIYEEDTRKEKKSYENSAADEDEISEPEIKRKERIRHSKRVNWPTNLDDYEPYDDFKKQQDLVYGDKFDSALRGWFEFIQLDSFDETLMKINFKIDRLKEQLREKNIQIQEIFYEFFKGYLKLNILQCREDVITLTDSLNYFRSVERSITLRLQELHSKSKIDFLETMTTKVFDGMDDGFGNDIEPGDASINNEVSGKGLKHIQDDVSIFGNLTIDIYDPDQRAIVYDLVTEDFQKVTTDAIRAGAHFIDFHKDKATSKPTDGSPDNVDREALLAQILSDEARMQFSKAKFVGLLYELLMNTYQITEAMEIMKYIRSLIKRRPKLDLFGENLLFSYKKEIDYYDKIYILLSSMIVHQKITENEIDDFQQSIFTNEEMHNLIENQGEMLLKIHRQKSVFNVPEVSLKEIDFDESFPVKELQKEFQYIKPYDSLTSLYYVIRDIDNAIEFTRRNLIYKYDFQKLVLIQNDVIERTLMAWDQIKYNLTHTPAIKDFETLECDVLMDLNNSYEALKKSEKYQAEIAGKKSKEFISEVEFFKKVIEFNRLKESLLLSLASCAYQCQIYLEQISIYGKEMIYKDIAHIPGEFSRHFLNLILSFEAIRFGFDITLIGESRYIVLNPGRLEELWHVSEYYLLNELMIRNALSQNFYHLADILKSCKSASKVIRILKSPDNNKHFYNILEKKNSWLINAKINPVVFTGKSPTSDTAGGGERIKTRLENIIDFIKILKRNIYFDCLRLQAIDYTNVLKKNIKILGLDIAEIFKFTPSYSEEAPSTRRSIINFTEITEKESIRTTNRRSEFFENYFDDFGRWNNIFIVPSTQDLIQLNLEVPELKKKEEEPEKVDLWIPPAKLAGKVSAAYEVEMGKNKKRKNPFFPTDDPDLDFLNLTTMTYFVEATYYLMSILNLEMFFSNLETNNQDLLLLVHDNLDHSVEFKRNKMRIMQSRDLTAAWAKKFKMNLETLQKNLKSNDRVEDLRIYLRRNLKYKFQLATLSTMECNNSARMTGDKDSMQVLKLFLTRLVFNTLFYLYRFNESLEYNQVFNNQEQNEILNEINFQDSALMNIIDFVFLDPRLHTDYSKSDNIFLFSKEMNDDHDMFLFNLLSLRRSNRSKINTIATELSIHIDDTLAKNAILSNYNILEFTKQSNKILKQNMKIQIMKETLLFTIEEKLPFTDITLNLIKEVNNNLQYHFTRALTGFIKHNNKIKQINSPKGISKFVFADDNLTEKQAEEIKIDKVHSNQDHVRIMNTIICIELEKVLIKEGLSFYQTQINQKTKSFVMDSDVFSQGDVSPTKSHRNSLNEFMRKNTFTPVLYSFTSKVLSTAKYINALNLGECIVIPVAKLQNDLFDLNNILTRYFDQMKFETHQKYQGKLAIYENDLHFISLSQKKLKDELDDMKNNFDKIIEARVSEISSKLLFDVDHLKKKIKHLKNEHDFNLREMREKIREEFKEQHIQDVLALKREKKRFYEFKEGLSLELRNLIDTEKGSTLRMIKEIRTTIFERTQPPETRGDVEDPFDFIEEGGGKLVDKLYSLLKKTRVLYQFREIVLKEKCEKKIEEMKQHLLANQGLLNKVNDLQNNQANLRQDLTDTKKELAVVERHNNILRKTVNEDQKAKMRLIRDNNMARLDYTELGDKYGDLLKQKAVFVPSPNNERPKTASAMRYTNDFISGKSLNTMEIRTEYDKDRARNQSDNFYQSMDDFKPIPTDTKRGGTAEKSSLARSIFLSPETMNRKKSEAQMSMTGHKSSSYLSLSVSKPEKGIVGIDLKSGKKVKKNSHKGFLVKKFNRKLDTVETKDNL